MMEKFLGAIAGIALFATASSASAAIIFYDDFERVDSNTVGNGWSEIEDESDDVRIKKGELRLRDYLPGNPDSAATQLSIDLTGYTNLNLMFKWKPLKKSDSNDDFYAAVKVDGGSYTNVFSATLGGNDWVTSNVNLSPTYDNSAKFALRFWTDVGYYDEGVRIEYVKITGDATNSIASNTISIAEPATLGLFGVSLVGLGLMGRRRMQH